MSRERTIPYLTTARIEAFSDGVFAIAITLLVIEIKVPDIHLEGGAHILSLAEALFGLWPSYLGYVLSFIMLGIYWSNHHYIFHLYRSSDHVFALLNVAFLMCISFLPFPTAVLAEYITDPEQRETAMTFYAFCFFLPAVVWLLIWLYANTYGLIDSQLDKTFVKQMTRQFIVSNIIYFIAVLVCFWNGLVGFAICMALNCLYLLPPKKPVYQPSDDPSSTASAAA